MVQLVLVTVPTNVTTVSPDNVTTQRLDFIFITKASPVDVVTTPASLPPGKVQMMLSLLRLVLIQ